MPTAKNAKSQYEAGQNTVAMSALSDSGDRTTFEGASGLWSRRTGYAYEVRPNGLISGGEITAAASGDDDVVDVAAGSAYINGVLVEWAADTDVAITRGLTTDTHAITSITVTAAGAVAAVAGTDGTAHSETRAAEGGPPLIAVTSIEIGQVRTSSVTAAAVLAAEIKQVFGQHCEHYMTPSYTVDEYAGEVTFAQALPAIHTGALPKAVYASYSTPIFADIPKCSDFVAPENSYSVNSTEYYGGTEGSVTSSLNAGSFTTLLQDGVSDPIVQLAGENLWFRHYPDRARAPYVIAQGILGIARTWPAGDSIQANCSINADAIGRNVTA